VDVLREPDDRLLRFLPRAPFLRGAVRVRRVAVEITLLDAVDRRLRDAVALVVADGDEPIRPDADAVRLPEAAGEDLELLAVRRHLVDDAVRPRLGGDVVP